MLVSDQVQEIITAHPQGIREEKQSAMVEAIRACLENAQVCTTCSDACMAETRCKRFVLLFGQPLTVQTSALPPQKYSHD